MSNKLQQTNKWQKIKKNIRFLLTFHLSFRYSLILLIVCCSMSSFVVATKSLKDNFFFSTLAYGLSILSILFFIQCLRSASVKKYARSSFLKLMGKTSLTKKLALDYSYRTLFFTSFSVVGNTLICISKAYAGWVYSSIWFSILSVYYIVLIVIKTILVHSGQKKKTITSSHQLLFHEWHVYNVCGKMVLFLAAILQILVVLTVNYRENSGYNENIVYLMAAYDFYCIFSTGYHTFSKKKNHTPITKSD